MEVGYASLKGPTCSPFRETCQMIINLKFYVIDFRTDSWTHGKAAGD